MSIEEVIRKYIMLANDERSRRIMMKKNHPSIAELTTFEAEYRQIANWLQELKERREKESRCEKVIRDPDEPTPSEKIEGYVISPETIEAMGKLVKTLTETLPEIISGALEEYFRRKEESK